MSAMSIVITAALVIISLFAIAVPLVNQRNTSRESANALSQKERDELLTDYERILATIRDLDEDHQTGKIAQETYQQERTYWTEQGIILLQQLEPDAEPELEPKAVSEPDKVLDDAIEQAIAAYRSAEAKSS